MVKAGDYTFYILNFASNEQIDLAVSNSSQDVLILEDNSASGFNNNSGSSSSASSGNKEEFDEQLADSLIRNSNFAPTSGAKLIKSEKIESIPNFTTNAYTYRDSDMMWIFYVRKSIKTGQYEVSNRPFANVVDSVPASTPAPTQLPAKFTPSDEQLKVDGLIRANQWAPTSSAKLIRVEKSASDSTYENYVYTYNESDMMWAFFVRKNIKTGQY